MGSGQRRRPAACALLLSLSPSLPRTLKPLPPPPRRGRAGRGGRWPCWAMYLSSAHGRARREVARERTSKKLTAPARLSLTFPAGPLLAARRETTRAGRPLLTSAPHPPHPTAGARTRLRPSHTQRLRARPRAERRPQRARETQNNANPKCRPTPAATARLARARPRASCLATSRSGPTGWRRTISTR